MTDTLRVAMIGHGFMGAAHSQGWRVAPRFFDLPLRPRMAVVVGRRSAAAAAAAATVGTAAADYAPGYAPEVDYAPDLEYSSDFDFGDAPDNADAAPAGDEHRVALGGSTVNSPTAMAAPRYCVSPETANSAGGGTRPRPRPDAVPRGL